jgi:hypothetical protein
MQHGLGKVRELQALNFIGSRKPRSGLYPEPDEYNPHPNPPSSTQMFSSHLCLGLCSSFLTHLIFLLMIIFGEEYKL